MELILWRHAEAEEGAPDMKRRLTARGHKHAARMANWMLARLPSKFGLLASPAMRAQQTADALGVPIRTIEALAPGASVADILSVAGWPAHKGTVVLVGHQPDLGRAAAQLVSGKAAGWTVRKGGLWWISNRLRDGDPQVVVRAVIAPDLL
jgi:phosphohistidine phosphatase